MKRILLCLISLVVVFSARPAVSATGGSDMGNVPGENFELDVTARVEKYTNVPEVYCVDIMWENLTFTYTERETKEWDYLTHTYKTVSLGKGWDRTEALITVTNHSNAEVFATVEYTRTENNGVTGEITNGSKTLKAGEEGKPGEADSFSAVLKIGGVPSDKVASEGVKIGSITVTINNQNWGELI